MRLVVLESPYKSDFWWERHSNIRYARKCIKDCITRGESPIASHLLYTQPGILRDHKKIERALGIRLGHAWLRAADALVMYIDHGITEGMKLGEEIARKMGVPVEHRYLMRTGD